MFYISQNKHLIKVGSRGIKAALTVWTSKNPNTQETYAIKRLLQILRRSNQLKLLMSFWYNQQSATKGCISQFILFANLSVVESKFRKELNFVHLLAHSWTRVEYPWADTTMTASRGHRLSSLFQIPSTVSSNFLLLLQSLKWDQHITLQ